MDPMDPFLAPPYASLPNGFCHFIPPLSPSSLTVMQETLDVKFSVMEDEIVSDQVRAAARDVVDQQLAGEAPRAAFGHGDAAWTGGNGSTGLALPHQAGEIQYVELGMTKRRPGLRQVGDHLQDLLLHPERPASESR